jgi:hypothetical protein
MLLLTNACTCFACVKVIANGSQALLETVDQRLCSGVVYEETNDADECRKAPNSPKVQSCAAMQMQWVSIVRRLMKLSA